VAATYALSFPDQPRGMPRFDRGDAGLRSVTGLITFGGTYDGTNHGTPVLVSTFPALGFSNKIASIEPIGGMVSDGRLIAYDPTTGRIKLYQNAAGAGALVEVPDATPLSGTIRVRITGA
jgi:hypothetical protein